jgi:hypothetical protein
MKPLRALTLLCAALATAVLLYSFMRRVAYPYDLEWMEGGMLCHALRIANRQPLYAPPSLEFVPFLYTPLYPLLVAGLGKVFGIGYLLGRLISVLAFLTAMVLGYVFARREGGSRPAAFAALALPAAAWVPTAAWHDLARPDSLFLGLTTAALMVGWWKRKSQLGVAAAAALMVAAFFTKQTASPFMIALGVALLVANWRVVPVYVGTLAALGLPLLYWLNRSTDGWFWTYVFKLHQQHDFYAGRAFLGSPVRLILLLGPSLLLVPWALMRRRSPGLVYAAWIGATGAGAACLGFGTQWAFTNAFIPGVFFPSLAIGVAAGRLIEKDAPRLRPHVVYAILLCALAIAPGGLLPLASRITPRDWAIDRDAPTGYDPRPYLPARIDRERAAKLIDTLRGAEGDVLIPFHPFYAHLAGKRTYLHRMGVLDVGRAGLGVPRGLGEAIAAKQFSLVIMDNKIDGNWHMWPGLQTSYPTIERIDGPRVFSGAQTEPRYLLRRMVEREP